MSRKPASRKQVAVAVSWPETPMSAHDVLRHCRCGFQSRRRHLDLRACVALLAMDAWVDVVVCVGDHTEGGPCGNVVVCKCLNPSGAVVHVVAHSDDIWRHLACVGQNVAKVSQSKNFLPSAHPSPPLRRIDNPLRRVMPVLLSRSPACRTRKALLSAVQGLRSRWKRASFS